MAREVALGRRPWLVACLVRDELRGPRGAAQGGPGAPGCGRGSQLSDGRWFPTRHGPWPVRGGDTMRLVGEELGSLTCCLGLAGTEPHRRASAAPPVGSPWGGQEGQGQTPSDAATLQAVMLKERTKPLGL